jgi:hypothetical protein
VTTQSTSILEGLGSIPTKVKIVFSLFEHLAMAGRGLGVSGSNRNRFRLSGNFDFSFDFSLAGGFYIVKRAMDFNEF